MIGFVSATLTVNVGGLAGGAAAAAPPAAFLAFFPFLAFFAGAAAALTGTKSELNAPSGEHPAAGSPEVTVWFYSWLVAIHDRLRRVDSNLCKEDELNLITGLCLDSARCKS